MESTVGGPAHFEPFLKAYFDNFAGRTVTSWSMRDFYLAFFKEKAQEDPKLAAALAALDWDALFYGTGTPAYMPPCDAAPIKQAQALAERWRQAGDVSLALFDAKDIEGWSTQKLCCF